ncbi:MAG: bifunctional hydroxymethylpyrimidine kinase/phosphomethylpyrimidine kinase [Terriglobales bacterium]
MPTAPPVVLTIAGFDPSSGAGITADIKVIAAQGCYGVSCITALTVQSTQGVRRVQSVDPEVISASLDMLLSDFAIEAVHVGMLANERVVRTVADFLSRARLPHVVLDPILKSSSGANLLDSAGTKLMIERLFPLVELVTPNLDEATALAGMGNIPTASLAASVEAMREAARRFHSLGAANVVVTGGHLEKAIDLLSFTTAHGIEQEVFKAERQRSTSTHGTGCAFATALACHLAHGRGLPEAVLLSKAYISAAIANAYPLGHGAGPLHHLYRMHEQRRPSQVVTENEHAHSRN